MSSVPTIKSIYTDGACLRNPGPGGWGVVIYFNDGSIHEMGDCSPETTNNRMEMQAAISALQFLKTTEQRDSITLYTDSEYLINCVTKWVNSWKKKGWKKSDGKQVLNQDLLATLDRLNTKQIKWQHVRGHSGNPGNERCDQIASAFASGKSPVLKQSLSLDTKNLNSLQTSQIGVAKVSDSDSKSTIINKDTHKTSTFASDTTNMDSSNASAVVVSEDKSGEIRIAQLHHLVETLRIADEIAEKGYLITSSELADLMDVHASAVTSRGDQWRWRNWVVSRVRREGNQILWELERADLVNDED